MPPQFLIIGLSQLTEPLIPSYIVKLEHYQIKWTECLESAFLLAFEPDAVNNRDWMLRRIDYSFSDYLHEVIEEKLFTRQIYGDFSEIFTSVNGAFINLTWAYYSHFFYLIQNNIARYYQALDSVQVERVLMPNEDIVDVVIKFKWDLSRLS